MSCRSSLGVAILVAVLVRAFVLQTFFIPSPSMEHTLNVLDRVLVNKLVYDFRDPHRGEIMVFKAPDRVADRRPRARTSSSGSSASAATTWSAATTRTGCMINGHSLDEPYIYRDADGTQDPAADEQFDITVPAGRLWVMGDHRSQSGDSLEHWQQSEATSPRPPSRRTPSWAGRSPSSGRSTGPPGSRCRRRSTAIPDAAPAK